MAYCRLCETVFPTPAELEAYLTAYVADMPPEERAELTALLARAGLTRITAAGTMSAPFPGEGHDGEYPLRRYVRVVDIE